MQTFSPGGHCKRVNLLLKRHQILSNLLIFQPFHKYYPSKGTDGCKFKRLSIESTYTQKNQSYRATKKKKYKIICVVIEGCSTDVAICKLVLESTFLRTFLRTFLHTFLRTLNFRCAFFLRRRCMF